MPHHLRNHYHPSHEKPMPSITWETNVIDNSETNAIDHLRNQCHRSPEKTMSVVTLENSTIDHLRTHATDHLRPCHCSPRHHTPHHLRNMTTDKLTNLCSRSPEKSMRPISWKTHTTDHLRKLCHRSNLRSYCHWPYEKPMPQITWPTTWKPCRPSLEKPLSPIIWETSITDHQRNLCHRTPEKPMLPDHLTIPPITWEITSHMRNKYLKTTWRPWQ